MEHAHDIDDDLGDICWGCMYKEVASHFEGDVGTALFDYYDTINEHFFNGRLPHAFLLTALTNYGACIGMTKHDTSHKPIILIHPTLNTPEKRFYTVLHEAIHVHVRYNLGVVSYDSKTSHSNDAWLAEVNRIAPMLGYRGVTIGYNKVTRAKKEEGGGIARICTGSVPYECSYSFPQALETATGQKLPPIEQFMCVTSHCM